jgi:Bacterial archaeo-eukaryotic release factor family 3
MIQAVTPEIREVMEAVHYRPAVSIIMPFEQKMSLKASTIHSLKIAADKVEQELLESYPVEMSSLVMQKLRVIIKNLNFNTHKKSIAIYVSPVFEKVLYLDMAVEEKLIIDESFEIRDLLYNNKQLHEYLVLLLSGKESRTYLGNSTTFVRIASNAAESVYAYVNEVSERVANFSDLSDRKEIVMEKFLHHIDNALDDMLNDYHLPVFVLGPERTLGHFKNLTKHARAIVEYVHGNYEEVTLSELKDIMEPHIIAWGKLKEKDLLNQLEEAAGKRKLAIGMNEVWRGAMTQKGRLLAVEKNYICAAQRGSSDDIIHGAAEPFNKFSCIKDAVDEIIKKVLENGGDVEFVENDILKDYNHIALIKYY